MEIGVSFPSAATAGSSRRPRCNTSRASSSPSGRRSNAERYGFDFALSMIKLRGFGGRASSGTTTRILHPDGGLAAVTSRISSTPRCRRSLIPPAIARACARLSILISGGCFGLNVITGWQRPEYSQTGLWPGDEYFACTATSTPPSTSRFCASCGRPASPDFMGKFFAMNDCRLSPRPQADEAHLRWQSDAGMAFTAKYADYNFCFGMGFNTPTACAPTVQRMQRWRPRPAALSATTWLFMVIAGETDAEARPSGSSTRTAPTWRRCAG